MPSRNILRQDVEDSYYHVYARGASKQVIFHEERDYLSFLQLFAGYLSPEPQKSSTGVWYPHLVDAIELNAYCLMPNHFHLLVYQKNVHALSDLMRSVMTSYSRYFNLKYKRSGSLFESRYKAARIDTGVYLEHISRYIHLNPKFWRRYPYSSLQYYLQETDPEWLNAGRVRTLFKDSGDYLAFLKDYQEHKAMIDMIKHELADI